MTDVSSRVDRRRRRLEGATGVEFLVVVAVLSVALVGLLGLSRVLVSSAARADTVLRSNSP